MTPSEILTVVADELENEAKSLISPNSPMEQVEIGLALKGASDRIRDRAKAQAEDEKRAADLDLY